MGKGRPAEEVDGFIHAVLESVHAPASFPHDKFDSGSQIAREFEGSEPMIKLLTAELDRLVKHGRLDSRLPTFPSRASASPQTSPQKKQPQLSPVANYTFPAKFDELNLVVEARVTTMPPCGEQLLPSRDLVEYEAENTQLVNTREGKISSAASEIKAAYLASIAIAQITRAALVRENSPAADAKLLEAVIALKHSSQANFEAKAASHWRDYWTQNQTSVRKANARTRDDESIRANAQQNANDDARVAAKKEYAAQMQTAASTLAAATAASTLAATLPAATPAAASTALIPLPAGGIFAAAAASAGGQLTVGEGHRLLAWQASFALRIQGTLIYLQGQLYPSLKIDLCASITNDEKLQLLSVAASDLSVELVLKNMLIERKLAHDQRELVLRVFAQSSGPPPTW